MIVHCLFDGSFKTVRSDESDPSTYGRDDREEG
jgi:hypothetical protein